MEEPRPPLPPMGASSFNWDWSQTTPGSDSQRILAPSSGAPNVTLAMPPRRSEFKKDGKGRSRQNYKCGRCGQPKKGHSCSIKEPESGKNQGEIWFTDAGGKIDRVELINRLQARISKTRPVHLSSVGGRLKGSRDRLSPYGSPASGSPGSQQFAEWSHYDAENSPPTPETAPHYLAVPRGTGLTLNLPSQSEGNTPRHLVPANSPLFADNSSLANMFRNSPVPQSPLVSPASINSPPLAQFNALQLEMSNRYESPKNQQGHALLAGQTAGGGWIVPDSSESPQGQAPIWPGPTSTQVQQLQQQSMGEGLPTPWCEPPRQHQSTHLAGVDTAFQISPQMTSAAWQQEQWQQVPPQHSSPTHQQERWQQPQGVQQSPRHQQWQQLQQQQAHSPHQQQVHSPHHQQQVHSPHHHHQQQGQWQQQQGQTQSPPPSNLTQPPQWQRQQEPMQSGAPQQVQWPVQAQEPLQPQYMMHSADHPPEQWQQLEEQQRRQKQKQQLQNLLSQQELEENEQRQMPAITQRQQPFLPPAVQDDDYAISPSLIRPAGLNLLSPYSPQGSPRHARQANPAPSNHMDSSTFNSMLSVEEWGLTSGTDSNVPVWSGL